jgi:DNA-binding NtrC family response regulator
MDDFVLNIARSERQSCPGFGGGPSPSSLLDRRPRSQRPRLLLIDDEPAVARFLAHAGEEHGYESKITINAASFRSAYEAEEPDVVAVDLAMPGADGVELLRYLAERKSRSTVLIISGFDGRVLDAAMRLGRALGLRMAGPLHKPVLVDDLIHAIRAAEGEALE